MSQLKKQSVAGRKNARRSRLPQSSHKTGGSSGARLMLVSTGRAAFRFLGALGKPCLHFAKKWPRATFAVTVSCGVLFSAGYGINLAMSSITQSLPKSFEINTPRQALHETITRITNDTLHTARLEKWSRSALTDKLLSRLSLVDGVDEVSIRAGLDKRLIVDVAAQSPVLVVIGKSSERLLVGNKFKVIARNVNSSEYTHLPVVEAPELNLQQQAQKERRKAHRGLFIKPASVSDASIRWIGQQALRISALYTSNKIPSELEKIVWKNSSGFSLVLRHHEDTTPQALNPQTVAAVPHNPQQPSTETVSSSNPKRTLVIIGEGKLEEKFERLEQVMHDLRLKQKLIEQIDLAFSDKAIIRMSETLSEVKRGGVQ